MTIHTEKRTSIESVKQILAELPGAFFIYACDETTRFAYVSDDLLKMLGCTRETFHETCQDSFLQMVDAGDRTRVEQEMAQQIQAEQPVSLVYQIKCAKDTKIWVHQSGYVLKDEHEAKWICAEIMNTTADALVRQFSLRQQIEQMQAFIDSTPVHSVVYQYKDGKLQVAAINGLFMKDAAVKEKITVQSGAEDLLKLVYPDDRPQVHAFFQQFYDGTCKQGEITYRTIMDDHRKYDWYRCVAATVNREDALLIYCTYTEVSDQAEKEAEYNHIVQELVRTRSDSLCILRSNLTKNTVEIAQGSSQYLKNLLRADNAETRGEQMSRIIAREQDRQDFLEHYTRVPLLKQAEAGVMKLSVSYRCHMEQGKLHWVSLYFHILQNPLTRDYECITVCIDADRTHKEDRIVSLITNAAYDAIGLIDTDTERMKIYFQSEHTQLIEPPYPPTFDEVAYLVSQRASEEKEIKQIQERVAFANIKKILQTENSYSCTDSVIVDGSKRRKMITFRWFEEDHQEIMFTLTDVTEVFQREEIITEQLHTALKEAETANALKSDFLGSVSHDMRTPLNAILGYNALALKEENVPPVVKEYLEKTQLAGKTLLSLINDTLDLQKIETGNVHLDKEPISCGAIVKEVITSVKPMMDEKKIQFVVDTSRAVMATINIDPLRMREIFVNLLSNAAKFTPEGGRVDMIVECVGLEKNCVHDRIIIRDTGIGMSQEFLTKIYEPFSQERTNETRNIGGSGLGLSIVRRTVDLMGGRIEVKSELHKGTEFTVYLDLERVDDALPEQQASQEPKADIHGLHILLCEDNAMNAEIAMRILEMYGADTVWQKDGRQGLACFTTSGENEFDAILMDIRMPVMDGYEAARKIRQSSHPRAKTIPIFAMTADAYVEDVKKALDAGMNGHLAKPLDPHKMIQAISTSVHQKN